MLRRGQLRSRASVLTSILLMGLGIGLVNEASQAAAATLTSTTDLLDFMQATGSSTWSVGDRSVATGVGAMASRPVALSVANVPTELGLDGAGRLIEIAGDGLGGHKWNRYDLSTASGAPTLASRPAAVVDAAGVLRIIDRSAAGRLIEIANDGAGGRSWSAYDLSSMVGGPAVTTRPTLSRGPAGAIDIYWKGPAGALWMSSSAVSASTGWTPAQSLSQLAVGPKILGAPFGISVNAVGQPAMAVGRSLTGDLVEYVQDGVGGRPWNAYDLSAATAAATLAADPAGSWVGSSLALVGVSDAGHVLVTLASGSGISSLSLRDVTTARGQAASVLEVPDLALSSSSLLIASKAASGDLLVDASSAGGAKPWTASDVSASPGVDAAISGSPAIAVTSTQVHVFAAVATGLARYFIVALAAQQDQYHGRAQENPFGSGCNAYTGFFHRGDPTGCPNGYAAEAWCSDFANWAWLSAGAAVDGINGWSFTYVDYALSHHIFTPGVSSTPRPGDAVIWGDMAAKYGAHVGIVAAVSGSKIDVISGNDAHRVLDSGFFDPASSTVDGGYPIIGYASPLPRATSAPLQGLIGSTVPLSQINRQDGGR